MANEGMTSIGALLDKSLFGNARHIAMNPGDFLGGDGFVYCGKCRGKREFKTPFGSYVSSLCPCGLEARAEQERQEQLRRDRARIEELAAYSLMDDRMRAARFESARITESNEKAFRIARRYVERFDEMLSSNTGLLLYGHPGTGKSYIAACIANALLDKNVPVMVTSIIRLTGGGFESEELARVLRRMRSARLLVLDDLGAERGTDYKAEQVFEIIDTRYNNKKPTVITTNLTRQELQDKSDLKRARVFDRIFEMCHPVMVNGDSWRVDKARENSLRMKALLEE